MRAWVLMGVLAAGCGEPVVIGGDAGSDGGPDQPSATIYIHLRATQDEVPHAPATSGQTPRDWTSGVRSLELLRTEDDPDPVLVFSHGDEYVEASYADGADTVVGYVDARDLTPGVYTWARVVHTHVRFTIDATLHTQFGPVPGTLEDLIVLSDHTMIDGTEHMRGHYEYTFSTAGMDYPASGEGFEVAPIAGGGFYTRVENGEVAYYFPANVVVRDDITEDQHLVFEVNVHEGFRWTDQTAPGYAVGVFDTTAFNTEPIVQAGANGFTYFLE